MEINFFPKGHSKWISNCVFIDNLKEPVCASKQDLLYVNKARKNYMLLQNWFETIVPPLHTRNDLDCWPKNSSEIPLEIDVIAATDNYLKPSTQTIMEFHIGLCFSIFNMKLVIIDFWFFLVIYVQLVTFSSICNFSIILQQFFILEDLKQHNHVNLSM